MFRRADGLPRAPRTGETAGMDGPRYADRFREQPAGPEVLGGDERPPPREWPRWLTRGGGVLAVAGAVALAMTTGGVQGTPAPEPTDRSTAAAPARTAPPQAPLTVTSLGSDLWSSRGFSYDVELSNPTATNLEIIDISKVLAGTEMLWNAPVVLQAQGDTTMRVDFLVQNCAAVINQAAPDELRLVLRPEGVEPGTAGAIQLFDLQLDEVSAAIDAAGGVRCEIGIPPVPNTMGWESTMGWD